MVNEKWLKVLLVLLVIAVSISVLGFFNTIILAFVVYTIKEYKSIFKWIIIGLLVAFFGGNLLGWLALPCIIYGIILYGKEQWKKDEEYWNKKDSSNK